MGMGRLHEAEPSFVEALVIAREVVSRRDEAIGLGNLCDLKRAQGDLESVRRHGLAALAIARESGDAWHQVNFLGNLAIVDHEAGRRPRAWRTYRESLALSRQTKNRRSEGILLLHMGTFQLDGGKLAPAAALLEEAARILSDVGDIRSLAEVHEAPARLAMRSGASERARELYEMAADGSARAGLSAKAADLRARARSFVARAS